MEINKSWIAAAEYRTSRRAYINEKIDSKDIDTLKALINEINKESGLNFQFIQDCSKLFQGFSASYGIIKGLNSCIALVSSTKIEDYKIKTGYYGEMLVLEATDMKLGTCWIGGTYDKKQCENYVDINEEEELLCVIAVGKVLEDKTMREKLISQMGKGRKSFDEILLEKNVDKVPDWVNKGIEFVIKAPSAVNKQPVGYSFISNEIKAYTTSEKHGYQDIDLGISMLHFELGARSKNHEGKWNYIKGDKIYK